MEYILFLIVVGLLVIYFLPLYFEQENAIKKGNEWLSEIKKENILEIQRGTIGVNTDKQEVIFSNWHIKTYRAMEFSPMFKGVYNKEASYKAGTIRVKASEIDRIEIRLHEKLVRSEDYIALTVKFHEQPDKYFFTESASITEMKKNVKLDSVVSFFNSTLPNIPVALDRALSS